MRGRGCEEGAVGGGSVQRYIHVLEEGELGGG